MTVFGVRTLLLASALVAAPACATSPRDPAPNDASAAESCGAAGGQQAINRCYRERYEGLDLAMETAWRALEAGFPAQQQTPPGSLAERQRAAQQAFLIYREEHCRSLGLSQAGGSATDMVVYRCLGDLTAQRRDELRRVLALF